MIRESHLQTGWHQAWMLTIATVMPATPDQCQVYVYRSAFVYKGHIHKLSWDWNNLQIEKKSALNLIFTSKYNLCMENTYVQCCKHSKFKNGGKKMKILSSNCDCHIKNTKSFQFIETNKIFKLIILHITKNCVHLTEKNVFCLFTVHERKSACHH